MAIFSSVATSDLIFQYFYDDPVESIQEKKLPLFVDIP